MLQSWPGFLVTLSVSPVRILEPQSDVAQLLDLVRDGLEPRVPQRLVLALNNHGTYELRRSLHEL